MKDKFGQDSTSYGYRYMELEPYIVDEATDGVTYICYTNEPIRAIRRVHKTQSGGVKTTTVENAVGAWEDRASLTYYPVNEAIPEPEA